MATDPTQPTQRYYRAPCPGCGAPVEFKSAQSTHAVCGYCQSTVVRSGEVLTRLGKMAELVRKLVGTVCNVDNSGLRMIDKR